MLLFITMCYYVENISMLGVFVKPQRQPRTLGVSTHGRGPMNMYLTVTGDHVGSRDCWQYSVSKLEVESLLQWNSRTFLNFFTRTQHQNSFFFTERYKLLTEWWSHFLGHARMKEMPTDWGCDNMLHVNERPFGRWNVSPFMLVVQPGLKQWCYITHPNSSKISCCQVFVFVYMWISHLNVVSLTNVCDKLFFAGGKGPLMTKKLKI